MAYAPFVPLRVLSSYSMLEGAIDPKRIAQLAKERGFPAIAICDRNGLYGSVAFAKACFDEGIQPIVGTLLGVARSEAFGPDHAVDHLPLYAQDETGGTICATLSAGPSGTAAGLSHVSIADLEGHTEGLIALTGASEGGLTRLYAGQGAHGEAYVRKLENLSASSLRRDCAAEQRHRRQRKRH